MCKLVVLLKINIEFIIWTHIHNYTCNGIIVNSISMANQQDQRVNPFQPELHGLRHPFTVEDSHQIRLLTSRSDAKPLQEQLPQRWPKKYPVFKDWLLSFKGMEWTSRRKMRKNCNARTLSAEKDWFFKAKETRNSSIQTMLVARRVSPANRTAS